MIAVKTGGFTLIELLVAITLLALISTVLFGGLRFGARAWETGTATIENTVAVETVQDLLRRTIAEAEAPNPAVPAKVAIFAGGPDHLTLVAPVPNHAGFSGLARYTLGRDPTGALALAWEIYRPDRTGKLEPDKASQILEKTTGLALSYYGSERPGATPEWRDRW